MNESLEIASLSNCDLFWIKFTVRINKQNKHRNSKLHLHFGALDKLCDETEYVSAGLNRKERSRVEEEGETGFEVMLCEGSDFGEKFAASCLEEWAVEEYVL